MRGRGRVRLQRYIPSVLERGMWTGDGHPVEHGSDCQLSLNRGNALPSRSRESMAYLRIRQGWAQGNRGSELSTPRV
jgi:hypothetical protein